MLGTTAPLGRKGGRWTQAPGRRRNMPDLRKPIVSLQLHTHRKTLPFIFLLQIYKERLPALSKRCLSILSSF